MARIDSNDVVHGFRHGRLTVIGIYSTIVKSKNPRMTTGWTRMKCVSCVCDCGTRCGPSLSNFCAGRKLSCGCIRKTVIMYGALFAWKKLYPVEYRTWMQMRNRCNNPKFVQYDDYGGRGIVVCERWNDFQNFIDDMGRRPADKTSIDRINNDGNYEPGNCRWSDYPEQAMNTRRNIH